MRILGIDPGTARLGFGIVDENVSITYGVIETDKDLEPEKRLLKIYNSLEEIVKKFSPEEISLENLFFNKNVKTAISVGEARGVVMLVAAKNNLKVTSYTPLQVKQGVTGYGKATKKDIQFMVKMILNLEEIPKPDDAADALAIAITHSNFLGNGLLNLWYFKAFSLTMNKY